MVYRHISISREDPLAVVTLHRPRVMNALNLKMMTELMDALEALDRDEAIRCLVLTGNEQAFSAGADITELAEPGGLELMQSNFLDCWDRLAEISKPLVAAVAGIAAGGGFELALLCDLIVAAETARFSLPELQLGVIPGAGGTQRLARLAGKHKAMEIVLAGASLSAREAEQLGLVSRIAPEEIYLDIAKEVALDICQRAPLAVRMAKQVILKSFSSTLEEGIDFERKCFYLLCDSEDKKEGMQAFLEKRKPDFTGR